MFDIYEKKLNAITKKYDSVLLEQVTPKDIISNAANKARAGLAATNNKNKESNVYSIQELRDILNSLLKTGFNNVNQSELKVIQRWADFALFGGSSDNVASWSLVAKVRSGALGSNRDQLWKDATQLTKLILEFSSKTNLGGIDTSIEAAGFSYEQLVQAYQDAKRNNISLLTALRKIKPGIKRNDLEAIFNYVATEFKNQADKLKKYDEELVNTVDSIKQRYLDDPRADAETKRVVSTLTYYDGLRKQLDHPAYKEVYDYTQNVYLPKVGSILRTVNALGALVKELQKYEREWQLNKEIQEFLDAMELWKGAEATRIRLEKLAKIKAGYEKFRAADTQSMENFYKQIPDLLWREVERVANFETGYRDDPTGIFPKWQGVVSVNTPGAEELNNKVKEYIDESIGATNAFTEFSKIFRDKDTFTSYVLEPKEREQAIYNLQRLYVNIKSIEDLIKLQEDSLPVKIKLPNVSEISLTTKDETGQTVDWRNFDIRSVFNTNNIKSAINWFAKKLPNRISAYDQRAETSIGRAVTNIDFEALDQKAMAQAEQMLQSIERGRSAGEEEFANREQIRQRAEDTVMQDKLQAAHQAASALAVQAQFNLRDEETSRQVEQEKITTQTIETLDLIISAIDVATNDVDNRSVKDIYEVVNYITVVFRSLSGEYYEDSRISNKFTQIEDSFQDLLRAKVASVDTDLDQALDLAQVELDKQNSRDINEDVVGQLLNIAQDSNLKGIEDAYPRGFTDFTLNTESVNAKLLQLANAIKELNRRLDRDNDPFFVLWYEITEDMDDLIARIKDLELDDLVPVVEKLDELESLINDDNMQFNYDKKLDQFETIVDITLTHKLNETISMFNEIRSNLVDADGNLKPTDEFEYEDFEPYVDMWELWQAIGEIYDAVDLEPSQLYKEVAKKIAAIIKNIPIDKMPFSGRSRDDFIDWVLKYGPQGSGRGEGELEVAGREEYRKSAVDENGFPLYNDGGEYLSTESQRKRYIRNKAINSEPTEVRQMLKNRRKAHYNDYPQYIDQPGKDPFIKLLVQAMRYNDEEYERFEIINAELGTVYGRNKELIAYLDNRISQAGEYNFEGIFPDSGDYDDEYGLQVSD